MADIAITYPAENEDRDTIQWIGLTSTDSDGASYQPEDTRAAIAAVQFTGTFDSATAVLQGSNDGSTWVTLNDTLGAAVSFTSAGYAEVSTAMEFIRPSTSGGGGSQDIDCILVARG